MSRCEEISETLPNPAQYPAIVMTSSNQAPENHVILVAVVFSCMASSAADKPGQLQKAKRYSEMAFGVSIASCACGVIILIYFYMSYNSVR